MYNMWTGRDINKTERRVDDEAESKYAERVGNARPYICQRTVLILLKTGLWASLFNYILHRPLSG